MKQSKLYDDQFIVVTGAAGFIGSGVVRYLNDLGLYNIVLVDDLRDGSKWKNLVGKKFVEILPREELFQWLNGRECEVEAFIHLGACSDTVEVDGDYLLNNNFRFSVKLAEYAILHDIRFIYASSAATYGAGEKGFSDSVDIDVLRPLNMYGYSKHLFDQWVEREKVLDKVIGLKYFNVFGPNEYHKGRMSSMILKMAKTAQKEGKIYLFKSNDKKYGNGDQCRDFIYVKDAVKMTCCLLKDAFKEVGGIFNIGRGEAVTWNYLAQCLFKALNQKVNIEYIDMPKDLDIQYQNYTCADMDKFHSLHGENGFAMTSIDDAVEEYVQQYILQDERW
jgi:ADP-L-glycero-D-manno-heptose 6-epimerase